MSNEMAGSSQATGRSSQKARTRAAIVEAARQIGAPTVERAADRAGVSRATAYRYFPTQEALEVELGTEDLWRDAEAVVSKRRSSSVEATINRLIDAVVAIVEGNERQVRTALRVYHDTWLRDPEAQIRKGRRLLWIDEIIEPLPKEARQKVRLAMALAIGPDPVTMLKDVAGLDLVETRRVMKWTAAALVKAALAETEGAPKPAAVDQGSAGTRGSAVRRRG
jgi:AcrR family transcriptional regulator